MGRLIRKCLLLTGIMVCLVGGISAAILFGLPSQFSGTYQHALVLQEKALSKEKSPKIVVMGDSSVPFSLNSSLMSRMTKRPVQTLALHSGTGIGYILRLSESGIRRGDIVVLELAPDSEDSFSPSIVLTACENDFSMYRAFSQEEWGEVIRYYPTFLIKKVKYYFHDRDQEIPSYSIQAFDGNGNYDYQRTGCLLPGRLKPDDVSAFNPKSYSPSLINTLNDYNSDCLKKGATFLVSFPPYLKESLSTNSGEVNSVQSMLSQKLKAPVITQLSSRQLPRKYFYDNVTHCNTVGADKVTADLAHEILRYMHRSAAKSVNGRIQEKKPAVPFARSITGAPKPPAVHGPKASKAKPHKM